MRPYVVNRLSTCCLVSAAKPLGRFFELDVGGEVNIQAQFRFPVIIAPYKYPRSLRKYMMGFRI
jgi:hypothetical protein